MNHCKDKHKDKNTSDLNPEKEQNLKLTKKTYNEDPKKDK